MTPGKSTIGPYELISPLGEGGMGTVFYARHIHHKQTVALKTIQTAKETHLQGIRREIQALARLTHPGIVKILDEGIHKGLPYYAMELLDGKPLSIERQSRFPEKVSQGEPKTIVTNTSSKETQIIDRQSAWWTFSLAKTFVKKSGAPEEISLDSLQNLPPQESKKTLSFSSVAPSPQKAILPSTLQSILSIGSKLCKTLAFLHGEGLVHRDLKPDNILLIDNEFPVLVDFGLTKPYRGEQGREKIIIETGLVGTPMYISPEQILGEPLDARADLYSLGVLLFELLTKNSPFVTNDLLNLLHAHLFTPPKRPSELVAGIPEKLDELVVRLLAKKRQDRPGYAEDIARLLNSLGADGDVPDAPKPKNYLYRPTLAGRNSQLEILESSLKKLSAKEGGRLLLLEGESGVGKTRLAMEVAKKALREKIRVLLGETQEKAANFPLKTFEKPLQTIADFCQEKGKQETERIFGHRAKVLAKYQPSLALLPGQKNHPDPEELPPEASTQRVYEYLAKSFLAFCEKKPLLLILDDLQWTDELSLGFLDFFLKKDEYLQKIFILGTYRKEEKTKGIDKLLRLPKTQSLFLPRLNEEAVGHMIQDMLCLPEAPQKFRRYLSQHAEGNPFFVAEYLQAAVEEGLLWRDANGFWQVIEPQDMHLEGALQEGYEYLPLPRILFDLVKRRLSGLSASTKELVSTVAVLGKEVPLEHVARILGLPERNLGKILGTLFHKQILEENPLGIVRFLHDKLREVAYAQIETNQRKSIHLAAANVLKTLPPLELEKSAALCAYHFEQAEKLESAKPLYLLAARKAAKNFSLQEAETLYRTYLSLETKPTEESANAHYELGKNVLHVQGEIEKTEREFKLALQEAKQLEKRELQVDSLRGLGIVYNRTGYPQKAKQLFQKALFIARQLGNPVLEGKSLIPLGNFFKTKGNLLKAKHLLEQAREIAQKAQDKELEIWSLISLISLYREQGLLTKVIQTSEAALSLIKTQKIRRFEASTFIELSTAYCEEGFLEKAETFGQQALKIFQQIGHKRLQGWSLYTLAAVRHKKGGWKEAEALYESALTIGKQTGEKRLETGMLSFLGLLYYEQGFFKKAKLFLENSLHFSQELEEKQLEGGNLFQLAKLNHFQEKHPEKVVKFLNKAEEIFLATGDKRALGKAFCFQGHLQIAKQKSAAPFLEKALLIQRELQASEQSDLGKDIQMLSHAQSAFKTQNFSHLFQGYIPDDLPKFLRQALAKKATRSMS